MNTNINFYLFIIVLLFLYNINNINCYDIGIDYFNGTGLISNQNGCFKCNITNECIVCSDFESAGSFAKSLNQNEIDILNLYIIQDSDKQRQEISNNILFGKINNFCEINFMVTNKEFKKTEKRVLLNGQSVSNTNKTFITKELPYEYSNCQNGKFSIDGGIDFYFWNFVSIFNFTGYEKINGDKEIKNYQYNVTIDDLEIQNSNSIILMHTYESKIHKFLTTLNFKNSKFDTIFAQDDYDAFNVIFNNIIMSNLTFTKNVGSILSLRGKYIVLDNFQVSLGYATNLKESFAFFEPIGDGLNNVIIRNFNYFNNTQDYTFLCYLDKNVDFKLTVDNVNYVNNIFNGNMGYKRSDGGGFSSDYIFMVDKKKNTTTDLNFSNIFINNNIMYQPYPLRFLYFDYGGNITFDNVIIKDNIFTEFIHFQIILLKSICNITNSIINIKNSVFYETKNLEINYQNSTFANKPFPHSPKFCNIINGEDKCKIESLYKKKIIISVTIPVVIVSLVITVIIIYQYKLYLQKKEEIKKDRYNKARADEKNFMSDAASTCNSLVTNNNDLNNNSQIIDPQRDNY